ncbi:MAG: hypothetical protein PHQ58_04410 [Rhodoferax sp.]|uniref:hypothetical protein n=1 Tax=Rhodoferax sp. TaxID=50421 RepID=UPI002616FD34|nr:hypothetical protein [Rhodoferax sp.]MDD2879658.1 hypothetical protein [Rhodoferax sp.]
MLIQLSLFKLIAEHRGIELATENLKWLNEAQVFGCIPFKDLLLRLRDIRQAHALLLCAHEDYSLSQERLKAVSLAWRGIVRTRITNALRKDTHLPEPVTTTALQVRKAEEAYWATKSNTGDALVALLHYCHVSILYLAEKHFGNHTTFFITSSLYCDLVRDFNRAIYS